MELKNSLTQKKTDITNLDASNDEQSNKDISILEIKKSLPLKKVSKLTDIIKKWLEIQDCVNCFYDTTKANKAADREGTGIKQLLEKKEGLFRMKMMGKRFLKPSNSIFT